MPDEPRGKPERRHRKRVFAEAKAFCGAKVDELRRGIDAENAGRKCGVDRVGASQIEVFETEIFVDEIQLQKIVFGVLVAEEEISKRAAAAESEMAADRLEIIIDEAQAGGEAVRRLIVRIQRDAVTCGVIAMVLRKPGDLHSLA